MEIRTVVVVDDDLDFLRSIASMLKSAQYDVCAFGSASRFISECMQLSNVGCVLLDERLEDESGLEVYHQIHRRGIQWPVIVVTGYATVSLAVSALDSGVAYLMEKPVDIPVLMARIQRCIEESEDRRQQETWRETQQRRLDALTAREIQVVQMVADGRLNKQIARRLDVSLRTVETYRRQVLDKIGARSVADLVVFAVAVGIRDVSSFERISQRGPQHPPQ